MGLALIIQDADFSASNLGKVNIIGSDLTGIKLTSSILYDGDLINVVYIPGDTSSSQKGVTFGLFTDEECLTPLDEGIATVDEEGRLSVISSTSCYIKITSSYKPELTFKKQVKLFPKLNIVRMKDRTNVWYDTYSKTINPASNAAETKHVVVADVSGFVGNTLHVAAKIKFQNRGASAMFTNDSTYSLDDFDMKSFASGWKPTTGATKEWYNSLGMPDNDGGATYPNGAYLEGTMVVPEGATYLFVSVDTSVPGEGETIIELIE